MCSSLLGKGELNPLWKLDDECISTVCFVSDENFCFSEQPVVCGEKYFNYCTLSKAKENLSQYLQNSDGVEFFMENISMKKLISLTKFEQIAVEKLNNMEVYCGYTPYFAKSILIDGKKVNMQIAVYADKIVAGFPMILTGF